MCRSEPKWLSVPESGHRRLPRQVLRFSVCVWKDDSGPGTEGANVCLCVQLCVDVCMYDSTLDNRNLFIHSQAVCVCVGAVLQGLDVA